MTNAELIKQIRHDHNLNTQQLGEKLGVSGRAVEDWEQGRRRAHEPILRLLKHLFGPA